jgi:RIO kinase 1
MPLFNLDEVVEELRSKKFDIIPIQILKSGKEAQVHLVWLNNTLAALKIFKNHKFRSFNNTAEYFSGRHITSRTMRQAVRKRSRVGLQYIQNQWVEREYSLLKMLSQKFNVPKVYAKVSDAVLMEYLGDKDYPAPLLQKIHFSPKEAHECLEYLIFFIEELFIQGFVHADLSEFNILWWRKRPYIIDFPQAVETRSNKHAKSFAERDLERVLSFFEKSIPDLDKDKYRKRLEELTRWI